MKEKYLEDLSEIKNMMQKSSQFLSLSGLAGVLAGIYALVGAYFAYNLLILNEYYTTTPHSNYDRMTRNNTFLVYELFAIAMLVLFASIITAMLLTFKKTKKLNQTFWNNTTKRLLINFALPLTFGGIFILLLIKNEYYGIIASTSLLFYGVACLNASKYTLRDVRYLGITVMIIGLFSAYFIGYGLHFWALGFGVCHIVYGGLMYYKYDRK